MSITEQKLLRCRDCWIELFVKTTQNFTRVYVDANKINMLFQGVLAGGTLYLTSQFPFAAPQIGALSEMVEYQTEFRDGIWFDLNYLGVITQWRWQ